MERRCGRSHRLGQGAAIHLISAYCGALRVSLGQVKTEAKAKGNEITAIPELLEAMLLKGAVVTIDAMGCQQGIAQKIVQGGANYVLAVKDMLVTSSASCGQSCDHRQ